MEITASQVKELRERTGAAMMDCKRALVEASGDLEKAIKAMRESGQAKADKKADRIAADGAVIIKIADNGKRAIILEVNSETDFVARDTNFTEFANTVATVALAANEANVEKMSELKHGSETVETLRQQLISKIGENIQLRRAEIVNTEGFLGGYIHGGRIAVLVELQGGSADLAKDIAMHIAASNPLVISKDQVPESVLQQERDIFGAQAAQSGKPADIVEKMVQGRINKYIDEVTLEGQPFVKDPNVKVGQLLKSSNATAKQFIRYMVGEGIEKKVENFAEEVMAQVR